MAAVAAAAVAPTDAVSFASSAGLSHSAALIEFSSVESGEEEEEEEEGEEEIIVVAGVLK